MAIAKTVLDVEPKSLEWLSIEDTDGNVWRYHRKGNADPDARIDVDSDYLGSPQIQPFLVRDADGTPVLRQDGPDLPRTIVVNYVSPTTPSPYPMRTFWVGKVEYEQEAAS